MSNYLRFTDHVLHSRTIVSLFLFTVAFMPRLLDLDRFLTADEYLWVDRSRNFVAGLTNAAYQCTTVVEQWEFAQGLACTLRTGHPGVTTMWTGSFGLLLTWLAGSGQTSLHEYVVGLSTNPLEATLIAPERFGTVLLVSLWVVAVYWLARRLLGTQIALVGALFIALDPFHIALSRVIHHDALSTIFMTLSALCAFMYWGTGKDSGKNEDGLEAPAGTEAKTVAKTASPGQQAGNQRPKLAAGRGWLILSGLLAGFGFLSKSPALYLMPFVAVVGLWFTIREVRSRPYEDRMKNRPSTATSLLSSPYLPALRRTILDGLLWFMTAAATVFIFWPAMWVIPFEALETVFFIGSKYATGGHAKGNFFLGTVSSDPGPLFYPISWLFRTSPLALIGVIALPVAWVLRSMSKLKQNSPTGQKEAAKRNSSFIIHHSSFLRFLPLILLFILGYYLFMTLGEKKQERYFLPVYPWLNLLAAGGLVSITPYLLSHLTRYGPRLAIYLLVVLILLVNGFLVVWHYPYYFTYYNPLLGGPKSAARVLTIGWGEGLDLVADYFNRQTNPGQNRVASWYQSTFAPFYSGPAISYSKEKGKVLAGDHVVFYVNQVQRRFPDDVIFDYIDDRFAPEEVITLHGIDYAWIYPSLGVDHYVEDQTYTGIASLLAWQWANGDAPLLPGQSAGFELYWEYLGKEPDEPFFFRLVDAQNRVWAEAESRPGEGHNPPVETWREGEIIYETGRLYIAPGTPPGQYRLQIGFYTRAAAVTGGELLFYLLPAETIINVGHASQDDYLMPAAVAPLNQGLGDSLTLLGATWPDQPLTGAAGVPLELYWRVEQALSADANLHLGLMTATGEAQQAWFNLSLAETFNPAETTWQPGDFILTRWHLDLLPEVSPGNYHFELVLPDDTEMTLSFGNLTLR